MAQRMRMCLDLLFFDMACYSHKRSFLAPTGRAYVDNMVGVTGDRLHAAASYLWDGWNIFKEVLDTAPLSVTNYYTWGPDLSGTMQGAGGVGGLVAVTTVSSENPQYVTHFPCYDANGNITEYAATNGTVAARYAYDAFGSITAQSGPMADTFTHRFSTKPFDAETGLVMFQLRPYDPPTGRFIGRDPIEEEGGINLYALCENDPINTLDINGLVSLVNLVSDNMGGDFSKKLLGPYGLPGPLGSRLQIHGFLSGEFFKCCRNGKKEQFAKRSAGVEAYLVWGAGKPRDVKGRDRNKPDPYRPGKQKKYPTDPPDSGYRSRSWHVEVTYPIPKCPKDGWDWDGQGMMFLRGSAGLYAGVQFNIQKIIKPNVGLTDGWSVTGGVAGAVYGATVEFGGGGSFQFTYGPLK